MTEVSIIREPEDQIADIRISLGSPRGFDGFYIVFRGEPEKVIDLLEKALVKARTALPNNEYEDKRGI